MPLNTQQINRLHASFVLIQPRIDKVIDSANFAGSNLTDTGLEDTLTSIVQHFDQLELFVDQQTAFGSPRPDEHELATMSDELLAAFAQVCDYAWTPQLREDWAMVLEIAGPLLLETSTSLYSRAA
tara:strand:- start:98922 stop:99299 length:378 start_codon:yes stop_codon:yes gene_type:complete